ncbi:MAG TPA: dTDP-4-dehydrorhamnose 3,5-epimerase [Gemmatimonadaceae bacterium]|nr:dTDP-4-dehydrorhamnose 3,5-epimerase [Gemmatimonadaceae bacterium]
MIFLPAPLAGAFILEMEKKADHRGYFARTWCRHELEARGLEGSLVQCSVSHNTKRGTLRGMHWQAAPHAEVKIVRCTRGAIWDVIIDLRPDSPTYMMNFGIELASNAGRALYIPEGMAHGFVTLEDESEVFYQMSEFYEPAAARGARWNDPAFGIDWPIADPIIHPRDASYPDFEALATR